MSDAVTRFLVVMVGPGPTIHEFLAITEPSTSKLVDPRAKHEDDGGVVK